MKSLKSNYFGCNRNNFKALMFHKWRDLCKFNTFLKKEYSFQSPPLFFRSSKYSIDRDMAPAFSYTVMQALLACYPLLPLCSSSGALRWFFILLNRAKCMDVELVAQKSCELLLQVSQHYHKRTHHLQALLKTRYKILCHFFFGDQ